MLTRRIIVCLDVKGGRVVKGVQFVQLRDVGDPVELAARYEAEGADEIVFLDISASAEERGTLLDVARRTAERLFIPLTIGGGVRTAGDVERALRAGADKVSINSAAVERPAILAESARRFGSQCVVASIDAKGRESGVGGRESGLHPRPLAPPSGPAAVPGSAPIGSRRHPEAVPTPASRLPAVKTPGPRVWEVYTHGGRTPTGLDAVAWARECVERGAGEILLTSIDRDGARTGYDLELTRAVADAVNVPVIASGGAGGAEHVRDAIASANADAALVAGILHDGVTTVGAIKQLLRSTGIRVRGSA
jgi:imidazole glycerol-phosphate synthase subunit HisF